MLVIAPTLFYLSSERTLFFNNFAECNPHFSTIPFPIKTPGEVTIFFFQFSNRLPLRYVNSLNWKELEEIHHSQSRRFCATDFRSKKITCHGKRQFPTLSARIGPVVSDTYEYLLQSAQWKIHYHCISGAAKKFPTDLKLHCSFQIKN